MKGQPFHLPLVSFGDAKKDMQGQLFSSSFCFLLMGARENSKGQTFPVYFGEEIKKSDQIRYILMNVLTNFPIKFDQVFVLFLLWVCFGKNIRIYIYMYLF